MIIDELFESPQQCPECGGISFSDLILAEKKDACYHKVKASAKVWPSAYASGRLVQCRKKGAANYGNKSEGVAEGSETAADIDKKIEFHKQGQAAAQYKGSMNKMHAAKIRELEAKKQALKQGVAEGSGQKPTITYKDYTLQYDYQTEDDDPEGYSTATTYYFDVFKDGNRVGEAEYFDYFGDLTIRINGKTKKFEHQHPLASQVSQLVSSLPDEQKRDLSDPKFESQGVAEGAKEDMSKEAKAMASGKCPHCHGPVEKKEHPTLTQYHCAKCGIRASIDKQGVAEGFPHDVDHMPGPVIRNADMTTDNVKTRDKAEWDRATDSINARVFDDMSEFRTDSKGETVVGDSAVWAKWDNATQTGWFNAKGRPLKPWPVKEQGVAEDISRRGFLKGAGAAAAAGVVGAAGYGVYKLDQWNQEQEQKFLSLVKDPADREKYIQLRKDANMALALSGGKDTYWKTIAFARAASVDEFKYKLAKKYDIDLNWIGNVKEGVAEQQELDEKWSAKYKSSINCANPKGFSQKAHCAGRKKNEDVAEGVIYGAENLHVGDDVIISGDVELNGATGVIDSFGQDKRFVVVDLYNHGRHSFHSSDVSANDYDSDEHDDDVLDEKSVSQAQFRTMAAAAHNPKFAKKVGISQDVAQEFNQADKHSNYKKLPTRATEGEQQKGADYRDPKEVDYDDEYDAMVARVKKLAGLGPMKTVYDPAKRQYRNMPTAQQPKK